MHKHYMQLALQEAQKGIYFTKPNPAVGCVIVKDNHVIATGYHTGFGQDHAEIDALKKINFDASGCDLYVTLEPCAHTGKTPPCVDAIIKAGVKRVIAPFADPNPLTTNLGFNRLRQHGIEVIQNIEQESCYDLNRFFMHFMRFQKPFVIAKWAMTDNCSLRTTLRDDACASPQGERNNAKWISCEQSRQHTHLLRQRADAIVIGANTLRIDNPALTTRAEIIHPEQRKHPLRIVLTNSGDINTEYQLLTDEYSHNTLIASAKPLPSTILKHCEKNHVKTFLLTGDSELEKLQSFLTYLSKQKIMSLIIEGGETVLTHFFKYNLVDEIQCYIANKNASPDLINDFTNIYQFITKEHTVIGDDSFIRLTKEHQYV